MGGARDWWVGLGWGGGEHFLKRINCILGDGARCNHGASRIFIQKARKDRTPRRTCHLAAEMSLHAGAKRSSARRPRCDPVSVLRRSYKDRSFCFLSPRRRAPSEQQRRGKVLLTRRPVRPREGCNLWTLIREFNGVESSSRFTATHFLKK